MPSIAEVLPRRALTLLFSFFFAPTVFLWLLCSYLGEGNLNDLAHVACIKVPVLTVVECGTNCTHHRGRRDTILGLKFPDGEICYRDLINGAWF